MVHHKKKFTAKGSSVQRRRDSNAAKGSQPSAKHDITTGRTTSVSKEQPASDVLGFAFIAAVTSIAYSPTFSAGFVWDDVIFTEAPEILNFSGIFDIWLRPRKMQEIHYWPVTYTSFWIEYRIWGLNPMGYHLTNVVLHIANACLVWKVLQRIGFSRDVAFLAATLFAIHPLNVESVAWCIERKDTLSGFFYLAALLFHPNIDVRGLPKTRTGTVRLCIISLFCFVLGMLSKTIVVSLPATLLLIPWFLHGRITVGEFRNSILFFVIGIGLAGFDVAMARAGEPVHFGHSLLERVLIATRSLCFYGSKIVWPGVQMVIYPRWDIQNDQRTWYLCFAIPVVLLVFLFILRDNKRLGRGPLAAFLFFAGTLFPVLGFVDYGFMSYSYVADRFQYLASLGPISCLSVTIARLVGVRRREKRWLPTTTATMVVVALLAPRTWKHARIYLDQHALWGYIVAVNPDAKAANLNLANEYLREQRYNEALPHYERAMKVEPTEAKAFTNYGIALSSLNRHEESIEPLKRAAALNPRSVKALNALGNSMSAIKRYSEAVEYFRAALQLDGNYAIGWANMANDMLRMGQFENAVEAYETALQIRPQYSKARLNLASALSHLGRHDEASEQCREILSYDPGNVQAKERLVALSARV